MKQVKEMPTEGQFVAMWEGSDKIWSSTLRISDGVLEMYNELRDAWAEDNDPGFYDEAMQYYVLE